MLGDIFMYRTSTALFLDICICVRALLTLSSFVSFSFLLDSRARCECTSRYEGPNCQLRKSANSITEEDSTSNDPKTGIQSEGGSGRSLSIGAIVGIAVGGFVALIGLLLILGRRKGEESYNDSVISSVENTDDHEYA